MYIYDKNCCTFREVALWILINESLLTHGKSRYVPSFRFWIAVDNLFNYQTDAVVLQWEIMNASTPLVA